MSNFNKREAEIRWLRASGLARDHDHAVEILDEMAEKQRRADLLIFYSAVHRARECFGEHIIDERPYRHTTILVATIPSGVMSQVIKVQDLKRTLAIGALKEFVHRPGDNKAVADEDARLVAFVRDFPIRDRSGIFFSPFSAEAVHTTGGRTIDEKENLWRIEFEPIAGDYVLGMFNAWSQQLEKDTIALVLYISKSRVIAL